MRTEFSHPSGGSLSRVQPRGWCVAVVAAVVFIAVLPSATTVATNPSLRHGSQVGGGVSIAGVGIPVARAQAQTATYLPAVLNRDSLRASWVRYRVPEIRGLAHDPAAGTLWAATPNGALLWDLDAGLESYQTFDRSDGLVSDVLTAVTIDSSGGVWVGGEGGVSHRNPDGAWTSWTAADGLPSRMSPLAVVLALTEGPDGQMLAGTRAGLSVASADGSWAPVPGGPAHGTWVEDIAVDPVTGDLALALQAGVWRITAAGSDLIDVDSTRAVEFDADGNLWFAGTDAGVVWADDGRTEVMLSADYARDVAIDAEGHVWFATIDSGLHERTSDGVWTEFDTPWGHPYWLSLAVGADGQVWAGRKNGEVDVISASGNWSTQRVDGVPDAPRLLAVGPNGSVWIGGKHGVSRITRSADWTWFGPESGLVGHAVTAMVFDATGTLWLGTDGGGEVELADTRIFTIEPSNTVADRTPPILGNRLATHGLTAPDGSLWFSVGRQFIVRWPDGRWEEPEAPETNGTRGAAVDGAGVLWWADYSPLDDRLVGRTPSGTWTSFAAEDGLALTAIQDLDAHPDGAIWITGKEGLQRLMSDGSGDFFSPSRVGLPVNSRAEMYGSQLATGASGMLAIANFRALAVRAAGATNWKVTDSTGYPFLDSNTNDLAIDARDAIWIASSTAGVTRLIR